MSDYRGRHDQLRIVTIGARYFSQFHHEAWTRIEGVTLAAVCDADRGKAEGFAERFGIPRVYTDAAAMLNAERPYSSTSSARPLRMSR